MIIFLIGSHCTGKTTFANKLKENGFKVVDEVIRSFPTIKINEEGNAESQQIIFDAIWDIAFRDRVCKKQRKCFRKCRSSNKCDFVVDRSLVDVVAYTRWLLYNATDNVAETALRQELDREENMLRLSLREFHDTFILFDHLYPLVNDGLRSMNPKYQEEIKDIIHDVIREFHIPYIRSVDVRLKLQGHESERM